MAWKTLDEMDLSGQTVLVRVDINVPVENGRVTDATRIERIVPTVRDILDKGGRPILIAHLGRPKGRVVPELSLAPLSEPLEAALDAPVTFVADEGAGPTLPPSAGEAGRRVILLDNIRFQPGEEANDPAFAEHLARLGDVYVNDAFSAAHRAHASTEGIAHHLTAVAGRQMQAELQALAAAFENPKRPLAAVVGGAKVSTKIDVLTNLIEKVDKLIVGGGMANTFLLAQGQDVGSSLAEPDLVGTAVEVLRKAEALGCRILLRTDAVVAEEFKAGAEWRIVPIADVGADDMILDVGPASVGTLKDELAGCRTVVWNGPLGAFEIAPFGAGTFALAEAAARQTAEGNLVSVAGGGDTVAALNMAGVTSAFSYVSTAGGAFLEWLEGRELPGVRALLPR